MREVFEEESMKSQKPRLLSSIATAAGEYLLKQGYDIPVLCKYLDMVNVMTYVFIYFSLILHLFESFYCLNIY
jgi:GH18 family chitinase